MSGELSLWVAFAGGVVSFASPCVLPLMPGYIGYISGISAEEAKSLSRRVYLVHVLIHTLFFGAGFTSVFVAMGVTATSFGNFIAGNLVLFQRIAGVLIVAFGLQMTGILRLSWLYRERRFEIRSKEASAVRSFLLGIAFGFGWTPCVGPVLGAVLTLAASQEQIFQGGLLLFSYSLGMGVPFVLTAVTLAFSLSFASRTGRFLHYLHIGAGIVMILMGVLLPTGQLTRLSFFLSALLL
jgi:cytochrome c-type biogenesis protein